MEYVGLFITLLILLVGLWPILSAKNENESDKSDKEDKPLKGDE